MSDARAHGRRRAITPAIPPLLSSRREALALERTSIKPQVSAAHMLRRSVANGAGQKLGLALAVTGLALAVTVPSAASLAANPSQPLLASASESAVTAASDVPISFAAPSVSSALNPDGKLKATLAVKASNVSPQAAKGTLSAPLAELVESSPFGARINPLTGAVGEIHGGKDFAVQCSTAVLAAAGGTVTYAQWHEFGGGNRVVVDHGNGLATTYNHLSSIGVKVGQKVERGQQIALSGTTGNSTGCHLHFEVMVDDTKVDPQGWL
ncbi:M23 family metallopeptidase [Arthrobacter cryoconiti]|uniref:M23 family metallopeptidase n=1 Tax=Arthrobacter cryoconiti TaxID=748907 RepID=A0ABV8R4S6_9MICC|nr:M23 family metallopeptidase [Arthrobacter cryoconiti]